MRTGIENWILQHWYGGHQPPWYLRMLEPVYRAAYQYTQKSKSQDANNDPLVSPLLVVGNITVGGSGKTPLVISLCQLALSMDIRPGIASTGYGRQCRDTLLVSADSDTRLCGDEPVLLAKRTGAPVVVATHRRDAVNKLREMGVDLVISDDGLQQADLKPDIDICVVDGARGIGNGHLLPAGPLRESPDRLTRVDHVVTNGEWDAKPVNLQTTTMNLVGKRIHSLDDERIYPVDEFCTKYAGRVMHAVAGIGNPQRFFDCLQKLGINPVSHRFADHHAYTASDFESMADHDIIIMTEKDAVKCRELGLGKAYYLPVDAVLPEEFEHWFSNEILRLAKERI